MKLSYSFSSVLDWSNPTNANDLVELLREHRLILSKVDDKEPIRQEFSESNVLRIWQGRGLPGKHVTCYFLFKGQSASNFSGMVIWHRDLPVTSTLLNSLHMDISIPASKRPDTKWLVELGDSLFAWSRAASGFITEASLYQPLSRPSQFRLFLPGLFWVNYVGREYLTIPEFRLPDAGVTVPGGVRLQLGVDPGDPQLRSSSYMEETKSQIGRGWFAEGEETGFRKPDFDFSALRRMES